MKTHLKALCIANFLLAGTILEAAPEPYASVSNLPQTPYYVQDGYEIYSLASNATVIIDVESQDGGVARYLAQQANNLPSLTKIYSVNIWQSHDPAQKQLYRRFLSNVVQENTTGLITPIRMSSAEAAASLHIIADLIYVLGANDQQTIYNDILSWYPHLSNSGIICGNNWYESSVQTGVTRAATALDALLKINGNVWYMTKGS
jgi:hypothetical protein